MFTEIGTRVDLLQFAMLFSNWWYLVAFQWYSWSSCEVVWYHAKIL